MNSLRDDALHTSATALSVTKAKARLTNCPCSSRVMATFFSLNESKQFAPIVFSQAFNKKLGMNDAGMQIRYHCKPAPRHGIDSVECS